MMLPLQNALAPLGRRPIGQPFGAGDLLHRWTFDGVYTDDVDPAFTFVPLAGTPTFEAALIDDGVRCTQSPQRGNLLTTGHTAATIDGGGSFTACGWCKSNSLPSNFQILYPIRWPSFNNGWILQNSESSNYTEFLVGGNGGFLRARGPKIGAAAIWTFMAGVYDDVAESIVLYVGLDGAALNTYTDDTPGWTSRMTDLGAIRSCYFPVGDYTIDDARIYSTAFTLEEVTAVYDEFKP